MGLENIRISGDLTAQETVVSTAISQETILNVADRFLRSSSSNGEGEFIVTDLALNVTKALGIYDTFSLPIFAANAEYLPFSHCVPYRWDGKSDITFHTHVALSQGEDINDRFQMRLEWEHVPAGQPIPVTSNLVSVEKIVLINRNAQYDEYRIEFTIDYDIDGVGNEIQPDEILGMKLYRIAASTLEVTGEILVVSNAVTYPVNKMFAPPE